MRDVVQGWTPRSPLGSIATSNSSKNPKIEIIIIFHSNVFHSNIVNGILILKYFFLFLHNQILVEICIFVKKNGLFDTGSTMCVCSDKFVVLLGVKRINSNIPEKWYAMSFTSKDRQLLMWKFTLFSHHIIMSF